MDQLAGRSYIPKLYRVQRSRRAVVDLIVAAIEASGGRVVSNSFDDDLVAPMFLGAEDGEGHRYGLLVYPFTATKRSIRNRPESEHRFQIRFGDPARVRAEANPLGRDPSGVDITMVLAVNPELGTIVGLDPLVYAELPMGISGYYREEHVEAVMDRGWAAWVKEKSRPRSQQGESWEGLEAMVGFLPDRLLDYARFEALATSLGLDTSLRATLAANFETGVVERHDLEQLFGIDAVTILDIVESNFRLGVAVRGGVAEHHLSEVLTSDPAVDVATPIDADGQPDFNVRLVDGRELTVECKNASRETYKGGDAKVELQKTRDSGAGRKYRFDAFDVAAACLFSVTGRWEFRFRWTKDLSAWPRDPERLAAIQRIDREWADSLSDLVR
jgi:hypothetical protein